MRILAQLIFASSLIFSALFGAFVAGIVFREPDVCFLLAMGRWMAEHGRIPTVDPFSYTYAAFSNGNAYVVYQWLTELILYGFHQLAGPTGLLVFTAIILGIAFIAIPLRLFALSGGNMVVGAGITVLVMLASWTHPSVRPEMFSFLLTAILLELLARLSKRDATDGIDYRFVGFAFLLEVLWTNLHCLFIFYFILVGFFIVCLGSYSLLKGNKNDGRVKTACLAMLAGGIATLINPYFFSLWPYTFKMLTDPINKTILEMQPFSLSTLKTPTTYPWLVLALISISIFLISLRKRIVSGAQLYFLLLIPAAIAMSFLTVRTLPIAALMMCCGIAFSPLITFTEGKLSRLSKEFEDVIGPLSPGWLVSVCVLCGLGAYFMASRIIPPEIPEESAAFKPPVKAIKYLEAHQSDAPKGNMLNDSHYGAVMMWQMKESPKVFVDPRYFLYNVPLMNDYWNMVQNKDNAAELLDKYKIAWVFLPSNTALVHELSIKPGWSVVYSDNIASIVSREKWKNISNQ